MSKVVLSGYYGFGNTGDELVLHSIVRVLRELEPGVEIVVLSHRPETTARQHGLEAVSRWSVPGIIRALSSGEMLVSGGGSLLQDVTSAASPLYYLSVILLAKLLGKKTFIYAQGIGPLRRPANRRLAAWLLGRVDVLAVRDEASARELEEMGVGREIIVTADPVLGIKPGDVELETGREILKRKGIDPEDDHERLLGVFIRPWEDNRHLGELARACDMLAGEGWRIVFVPMHFPHDIIAARQALELMSSGAGAVCLEETHSPPEVLSVTKNLDLVMGMRLHALINGAVLGLPIVGLSYDPKVDRFLEQVGRQPLVSVRKLRAETLVEAVDRAYRGRGDLAGEREKRLEELCRKAWETARLAVELLRS
ncbi:MAG: polysaccharide pyruvyl transferase CsaB [Peptococcaceae bacterium]|nr:polysaccharide pyruvyl transferase CsaB [Peptococcaceae bacterium]MDH7525985.1 polysaccharide pyruvyl transferase CsaB [Peptococcaceae bacterium]